jgi:sulfur-carrier protein adenylyltransferase/sulfurtransferase
MGISEVLTDPEIRRFSRQMVLPEIGMEGQGRLKKAKVAVIGIGGIGSAVLQYLAASGVGSLGIIDYTLVDETNIQRQTLYGGSDLGKLKSIISKQHLQDMFSFVTYEIINLQLTVNNIFRAIEPFDLIVDATNDLVSSQVICEACLVSNIPLVYGSVYNFAGRIAVIDKDYFEKFKNYLYSNPYAVSDNQPKGVSVLAYGLIGNFIALEVFKMLVQHPEVLTGRLLDINIVSYQISSRLL